MKKYVILGVVLAVAVLLVVFWKQLFGKAGLLGPAGPVSLALKGDAGVATTITPINYVAGTSETPQQGTDFNGTPFPTTVFPPLDPF